MIIATEGCEAYMTNVPLVIFDMDGVLVDVSGSYREVSRLSVIRYLRQVIGAEELGEDFITLQDISEIKKTGGLNNDWDLTCTVIDAVLKTFFDEVNSNTAGKIGKAAGLGEDRAVLAGAGPLLRMCDASCIARGLSHRPVREVVLEFNRQKKSLIRGGTPSPFLLNRGDIKTGNLVKRLFQEIYLGKELFERIYGEMPLFYEKIGYIERERLIPARRDIEALKANNTLSIATGRPEVEAMYALEFFRIKDFFTAVVSEDDVVREEQRTGERRRKPHPFGIDLCIEKSGYEKKRDVVYYIGDMPDDIAASKRAGVVPIGFVNDGAEESVEEKKGHKKLLVDRGAFRVINNYRKLLSFFDGLKR